MCATHVYAACVVLMCITHVLATGMLMRVTHVLATGTVMRIAAVATALAAEAITIINQRHPDFVTAPEQVVTWTHGHTIIWLHHHMAMPSCGHIVAKSYGDIVTWPHSHMATSPPLTVTYCAGHGGAGKARCCANSRNGRCQGANTTYNAQGPTTGCGIGPMYACPPALPGSGTLEISDS